MKKLAWFVFLFTVAVSCLNEPDCFQLNNNVVVVSFKILGGGADQYPLFGILSPETDSVFNGYEIVGSAGLPLNPLKVETSFNFDGVYEDHVIQLGYKRQVQFVSAECGERYIFTELNVIGHDFDSVRLVNPTPTRPASNNIEVYRCPRTDLMGISFETKKFIKGITADFPTVIFQPGDSITTMDLPVNKDDSTTTFVFDFGDSTKTLKVNYGRTAKTLFTFCGEQTIISSLIVDTTVTDFDVADVLKDSIQDLPITNLENIQ